MLAKRTRQYGFTLIELSIVLVIIGLLVGGVLVGSSLIHSAEIRGTIRQYQEFQTALGTFKLKYDCLAGDCINPMPLGFTSVCATATGFGNGDGIIGNTNGYVVDCPNDTSPCLAMIGSVPAHGVERNLFWQQLTQAGLMTGWSEMLPNLCVGAGPIAKGNRAQWFVAYNGNVQNPPIGPTEYGVVKALPSNALHLVGKPANGTTDCGLYSCGGG